MRGVRLVNEAESVRTSQETQSWSTSGHRGSPCHRLIANCYEIDATQVKLKAFKIMGRDASMLALPPLYRGGLPLRLPVGEVARDPSREPALDPVLEFETGILDRLAIVGEEGGVRVDGCSPSEGKHKFTIF